MIYQIAGNIRLNPFINKCLDCIHPDDKSKFIKKYQQQSNASDKELQSLNMTRELALGAYLKHCGFMARYSLGIGSKKVTPDWSIIDERSAPKAIVELYNFHIDDITDKDIKNQLQMKRIAVWWADGNKSRDERLYYRLCEKADKYRSLVNKIEIPYIIAVFCDLKVAMSLEETRACIFKHDRLFFDIHSEVSGILHFEENAGRYVFNYIGNLQTKILLSYQMGAFTLMFRWGQIRWGQNSVLILGSGLDI